MVGYLPTSGQQFWDWDWRRGVDDSAVLRCLTPCSYLFLPIYAGRYFDEISQDTGKYCFGVEDTLKALEMGAVEILIVYENLDTMRYILRLHGAEQQNNGSENGTDKSKL